MGRESLIAAFMRRSPADLAERERLLEHIREAAGVWDAGRLSGEVVAWLYFQAEGDPCLIRPQTLTRLQPLLAELGPVLYYLTTTEFICETEDGEEGDFSGWGFRIFERGEERAAVWFSDAMPSYGEGLRAGLSEALAGFDPGVFRLFDLGSERERALATLLDLETLYARLNDEAMLEDIEREFARLLDLEDDFLPPE